MTTLKALASQLVALLATLALARSGLLPPLDILLLACMQGLLAAFMSLWLRCAKWWLPLQLGFMPSVVLALKLDAPPWLYLGAFSAMCLIFWSSFRTQVPLFLSNRATVHRLALWLPDSASMRILDLGCGTASFLAPLARLRPDWQLSGIESAPLPFMLARHRTRKRTNVKVQRQDFWTTSLAGQDVVYAFLSPVPMRQLWQKARREMAPGSWLVSNSFEVPGLRASEVVRVRDRRDTHLFCYRIPAMPGRHDALQNPAALP